MVFNLPLNIEGIILHSCMYNMHTVLVMQKFILLFQVSILRFFLTYCFYCTSCGYTFKCTLLVLFDYFRAAFIRISGPLVVFVLITRSLPTRSRSTNFVFMHVFFKEYDNNFVSKSSRNLLRFNIASTSRRPFKMFCTTAPMEGTENK